MRILFSTFWFANFVFRVLKCEAVIFDKYHSACVNGMSISNSWHATYTYLTLLQNACNRYDGSQKSRPSPTSRAAYQHDLSPDHHEYLHLQDYSSSGTTYGGIDMPAEEFYQVHTTNLNRPPTVSTLTPRKPLTSPLLGDPTPQDHLDPSTFLLTSTNF